MRTLACLIVCLTAASRGLARAQSPLAPAEQARGHVGAPVAEALALSYDDALALLDHAPELRARLAAHRQLLAAKERVSSLPADLQVNVEAGPRVGSALTAQGRASVSQGFSLGPLGSARRAVLDQRASALEVERIALRVSRRLQVGRAWLRVHEAHAVLQGAQAELVLADELARVTDRGEKLSELTRADAADAKAYAAEAKLGVLAAEGELTDARLELTRVLAVSDRVLDAEGEPPLIPEPDAAAERTLHARIEQQPAIRSLLGRIALLDARARELRATYASQLSLGVMLDHPDPSSWATLGMVGFSLPLGDRSRRERAELEAERTALLGEAEEQLAVLHVEVERVLHEIKHTQETLQHADTQLLPAIERGLAAREALFRSGEGTVLEIILARRSALVLRLRRLRLEHEWRAALARFRELSRAVGITP